MRILVILLVCFLGVAYAAPPRYYAVPSQLDEEDDADVQDEPFDNFEGMFTFPTGGPGGPPSNQYLSDGSSEVDRQGRTDIDEDADTYYLTVDPYYTREGLAEGAKKAVKADLARRYKIQKKKKVEEVKAEEEEEEDEEDDPEDDDDADDEPDYAVPDFNELFPNPENRPRGPGGYADYQRHQTQQQQQQQQQQPAPGRGRGRPAPPPPRRREYRFEPFTSVEDSSELYDTVVIDAQDRYRAIKNAPPVEEDEEDESAEDDAGDDVDDDAEQDDDVDFSVPSYDTLFPAPGNKPPVYGGMKTTWDNAPQPPKSRYGRVIRLFQSPMHHDVYNPDYIINPQIALERRNERMKYRYSHPNWRIQNPLTPYNYKPLLYQRGHWGNPREHDYNHLSGNHYVGGIYNGKTYY